MANVHVLLGVFSVMVQIQLGIALKMKNVLIWYDSGDSGCAYFYSSPKYGFSCSHYCLAFICFVDFFGRFSANN